MDIKELAKLLDGREYKNEISRAEQSEAKINNLVVVFGASDDLIEFRGAICDELGAYKGKTVYLYNSGMIENKCSNDGFLAPNWTKGKQCYWPPMVTS